MREAMIMAALGAFIGAAAAQERHDISQRQREFSPKAVSIAVGDVVVFKNDDTTPHHIKVTKGPESFRSRLMPRGLDYPVTFNEAGYWEVGCRIHPRMSMSITVSAEADARAAATDGIAGR